MSAQCKILTAACNCDVRADITVAGEFANLQKSAKQKNLLSAVAFSVNQQTNKLEPYHMASLELLF